MENVSLFRAEESGTERELRAMLGLITSEDLEPTASTQSPPNVPENSMQVAETASPIPDPGPSILNPPNPPAQPPNDMEVEQTNIPLAIAPPDQAPVENATPVLNPTPSAIEFSERPAPVSEPPSWNPITFVDDEDEEEEEIPSINMDSDSD